MEMITSVLEPKYRNFCSVSKKKMARSPEEKISNFLNFPIFFIVSDHSHTVNLMKTFFNIHTRYHSLASLCWFSSPSYPSQTNTQIHTQRSTHIFIDAYPSPRYYSLALHLPPLSNKNETLNKDSRLTKLSETLDHR